MEIKVGEIYRVKSDIECYNGSVLPKGITCEAIQVFPRLIGRGTDVKIKDNWLKCYWNVNASELEEVETMDKGKNVASNEQKKMEIAMAFHDKYTTAYLIKEGNIVKQETARCAPDDKFSIEVGAKLALERLFEKKNDVSMPSTYRISAYERMASTFADLADMNKRAEERNAKLTEEKRLENATTLIHKIADHYGLKHQQQKMLEELGELITAGAKPSEESHLVEEMADVSIMIEQMVYLLKKESLFAETREKKLDRQMKRIEEEQEKEEAKYCVFCNNFPLACELEPCKSCIHEPSSPNWERK